MKPCHHHPYRQGEDPVYGLVHPHAERFQSVAVQHRYRLLEEDRTRIEVRGHDVDRRSGPRGAACQRLLDRVHPAGKLRQQRRVDVDDATDERVEKRLRVDPVEARVDDKLHIATQKKIAHRDITLLRRVEGLLRKLRQRDPAFPRESGPGARRPVGGHRDHVEIKLDQVAEVRSLARHADSEPQRKTTRSGPAWRTTSPITMPPSGTSRRSTTRIIPIPMLKVPYISSSAIRPRLRISSKIGGTRHDFRSRRAANPSGRQRGRLPNTPPPVI